MQRSGWVQRVTGAPVVALERPHLRLSSVIALDRVQRLVGRVRFVPEHGRTIRVALRDDSTRHEHHG